MILYNLSIGLILLCVGINEKDIKLIEKRTLKDNLKEFLN